MHLSKLSVLSLLIVGLVLTSQLQAQDDLEFYNFDRTDNNMSVIISEATLDGEDLAPGDEVGVFTEEGLCAGAGKVSDQGLPVGVSPWGDEAQQQGINGFVANEPIEFRVWDQDAGEDVDWGGEIEIINGQEDPPPLLYAANGFAVVTLTAMRGEGRPVLWVSNDNHDFGRLRVGQSADWNFTVRNDGRQALVVTGMVIEEDYFDVDFGEEQIMEFQEDNSFTVTFSPLEEGEFEAVLTIQSNDEEMGDFDITLLGTAEPALPPTIVAPEEHNFGMVRLENQRTWSMEVGNTGDETLVISDISVEEGVFSVVFDGDVEVPSGETADFDVIFAPEEAGVFVTDLIITSNDPDNNELPVHLVGQGVEAGLPGVIALERDEHFFSSVLVDDTATWRMVILNEGEGDLWVRDIVSNSEVFTTDFGIDSVRVRPGDRWYVEVAFTPNDVLYFDGALTIFSDDPENGELICAVSGVGSVDNNVHFRYQRMEVNHSLLITEVLFNDDPLVEGDEVGAFTQNDLCAGAGVIRDDGRVGVSPWADDEATEIIDGFVDGEAITFKIWDADPGEEALAVPDWEEGPEVFAAGGLSVLSLSAQSGEPDANIRVSDYQHFYGQVSVDDGFEDWVLNITNVGLGVLEIESIESDLDEFTTDFDDPVNLEFNQEVNVTVTFTPVEERDYVGRLTINSNDPDDDVLYVDLFGQGVQEVREPSMELNAENYFFGVQHIGMDYTFVLEISNTGGDDLILEDIVAEGDQFFSSDFPGIRRVIEPEAMYELTITYNPEQAGEHNASFTIISNDPIDPEYVFPVRGYGIDSEDHFVHLATELSHQIMVDPAIITTLQDDDTPLVPGDEIAVFTPEGLCAGHVIVENEGEPIALAAFGNDPNTQFKDGFLVGDEFTFKFWDWTTRDELECRVVFNAGPEAFAINEQSEIELWADALHDEARITADPMVLNLGPALVDTPVNGVITIINDGGINLTVTGVESHNNEFEHDFDGEEIVLGPGESFDLTVTFTPGATRAYEASMSVFSDDPDDEEFLIYPVGMGSDYEGRYVHYISGSNHSILIQEIDLGGAPPAIGDEVGIFTQSGMCAGGLVIEEPGEVQGTAAFGDDADTQMLIEGFIDGEEMVFKFWDDSQEREYDPEVEVVNGSLEWSNNALTILAMSVENVFQIRPIPPIEEDEGALIEFELELVNAEGDFDFEWLNEDEYENLANAEFEFGNNVGDFSWQTDNADAGEYILQFAAFNDDDMRDETSMHITINNINLAPDLVEEVRAESFDTNDWENEVHIDEDSDWFDVVDLDELFVDPDEDELLFFYNARLENIEQNITDENVYRIRPSVENWSGVIQGAYLVADDQLGGMMQRQLRSTDQEINRDRPTRTLRSVFAEETPQRDLRTQYDFTIVVEPLNDPPEIQQPSDEDEWDVAVNENEELRIEFGAVDVEDDNDALTWAIDPDNLPDGWVFDADNAVFTWTPTFDDAGNYDPIFTVTDLDQDDPMTDGIIVNIEVRDAPRGPILENPIPDFTGENAIIEDADPRRTDLADLDDVFSEPDGEDMAFTFNPDVEFLGMGIDQEHVLHIIPDDDFNIPDPVEITVRATDPGGRFVEDEFEIVITPVNDSPQDFMMLTPENEHRVAYDPDSLGTLDFTWQAALQNQWEYDDVHYLVVTRIQGAEDTMVTPPIQEIEYLDVAVQDIADSFGLDREDPARIEWWVWAVDDEFMVLASNAIFWFEIPALGVEETMQPFPMNHYLTPTFPNPFNAFTTVQFGIPVTELVEVSVWDMHGRKIAVLANSVHAAGRYEAVWHADKNTSGIYMIRIQAGNYSAMQKAILIR